MRRVATVKWGLLVVLVLSMVVSACSNNTDSESTPPADAKDHTLTIGTNQDIDSFDTQSTQAIVTESAVVNLQSYLLKRDNEGVVHTDLAESYERIDDVTWHFKLKENVKFHNGDPLTSEDVKFTFDRVTNDKKLLQNPNYKTIKEVKIIDNYNFEIITHDPDPVLLKRLSREGSGIYPKKYFEEVGLEEFLKNPVFSGPFQFVEWIKGDRLVMKEYDDYFGGDVSDWDTLIFRVIPETSTRIGELLTGGIDIATFIPPTDWDRITKNKGTSIVKSLNTRVNMLTVNHRKEFATSDPKVREAIDYAIDKKLLIDKFTNGFAMPSRTRVWPNSFGSDESLYNTFRYNPEIARQLLKEAGYENNLSLTLQSSQGRSYADSEIAQMIAGMLEEVGIKVNLELMETSKFLVAQPTGQNKELIFTSPNNTFFDAAYALTQFRAKDNPEGFGYFLPGVDELLDRAAVNMNEVERAEQYKTIQQMHAQELPFIILNQGVEFYGVNDRIQFEPRVDSMFFAEEIKKAK